MYMYDTIAAISSAPGEGGIGIIRISGEDALSISQGIFRAKSGKNIDQYSPRTMVYGNIFSGDDVVDEALVVYMKGPNSYTKEDVVEINCHGGYVSLKRILQLVLKGGARISEPGEFTKRAFLNGRLDLSQAEAVMDVIRARTESSHKEAQKQLEGSLSGSIKDLRMKVSEILAHVTVSLDFPEEDIEEITMGVLREKTQGLVGDMEELQRTSQTGKILRDGLKTVIVGKPNVGKSSLLNAMLKEARAIVTDIAGTTRDIIEEFISIRGIPLKLIDTAGIRDTHDIVERMGVERTKSIFEQADLIILVIDSSVPLSKEDIEIMDMAKGRNCIVLINKIDLVPAVSEEEIRQHMSDKKIIRVSALESRGTEDIEDEIESMVYSGEVTQNSNVMLTNVRHIDALQKAIDSAKECLNGIDSGVPLDFVEIDLRNVWDYLGAITGETVSEDLLDVIFSQFCIGK